MRVAFTDRQVADLLDVFIRYDLDDHALLLEHNLVRRTAIRYFDAHAPAIYWQQIRDRVADDLYLGRRYRSIQGTAARLRRALKAIAQAVALREHHPGLRQRAALGRQHELLPAWWTDDHWSPYPTAGHYRILVPDWRLDQRAGSEITRWLPQDPTLWSRPDLPWLDERLHIEIAERRPFKHLIGRDERRRDIEPDQIVDRMSSGVDLVIMPGTTPVAHHPFMFVDPF